MKGFFVDIYCRFCVEKMRCLVMKCESLYCYNNISNMPCAIGIFFLRLKNSKYNYFFSMC